jgi:branched-chain amino acid transport system substrate-binding protein
MRLSSFSRAGLAAVLVAVLAACSSSGSSSGGASSGASGGVIKIGIDLPLSGADASIGIPTENGALLAIQEANKNGFAGGAFTLQASVLDDAVQGKHDPAAGAQNVQTFIADPAVLAMVGPFNSNVAKAEIPLTNDAGLAQISPSNTNDGLTIGDAAKQLRTAHPDVNTYFRVCTRDSKQGSALAQVAYQRLGFRKIFVIDDNETYGKGLADVFDASFRQLGGTVLGHEHITSNQVDFKALLTKIKALGPDAVSAANGSYMTVASPDVTKLPSAKKFVQAYQAQFKSNVGPYSANAYTAAQIEIAAIEKAIKDNGGKMPTRADVLKNIAATNNFNSPIGKVGFDANGDTTSPVLTLLHIENGKPTVVDVIQLKS